MAIDWSSKDEIAKDGAAFGNLMHAVLGLYVWEWFTSLNFDYLVISGKKPFRWPMMFYFANRYLLLFALIGIAIALNVTSEVDCQALYTFNQVAGNASIGLASINLSLRTIAVWDKKWFIVVPLLILIAGHWALLMQGILLTAQWDPIQHACVISSTKSTILSASFVMSMSIDFIVMLLTAGKLYFPSTGQSRLVKLIFRDGMIYFIIAFLANALATIFMRLNLNPVMSIIGNVPAATASTIVACRVVRRLSTYSMQQLDTPSSRNATGGGGGTGLAFRSFARPKIAVPTSVHVQMETFEESPASDFTAYDPNGQSPTKDKLEDLEAQTDIKPQGLAY